MSCLSRIGCLAVIALGGAGAWWYAGGELPFELSRRSRTADTVDGKGPKPIAWTNIDREGAGMPASMATLSRRDGPAYVSLGAPELAQLLGAAFDRALPRSASNTQVAIVDDQVHLRSDVALGDLGGQTFLGPLGRTLKERDTLEVAGTLEIVRPGLAQFRVRELRIHDVGVPTRLIPMAVSALRSNVPLTDSLASDGLPVPIPRTIADVRVSRGRVTLYKAIPKE